MVTVTSEVVVGLVVEVEAGKGMIGAEVLEEVGAGVVVGVHNSVSLEVYGGAGSFLGEGRC